MSGNKPGVCIVTMGPPSQNPRVIKEADALAEEGFSVTVVYPDQDPWTWSLDQRLVQRAPWRTARVRSDWRSVRAGLRRIKTAFRQKVGKMAYRLWSRPVFGEFALSRYLRELLAAARSSGAVLFIAHYPGALPVVARAARETGGQYSFDAEDLHSGECVSEDVGSLANRLVRCVEGRYLPGCCFVTAASQSIGDALQKCYGIPPPVTVLNTFPDSSTADGATNLDRKADDEGISFYWFSQIVSLDRGLQDAIHAIGRIREPVSLHIRGADKDGAVRILSALARDCGVLERVHFHSPVPPDELLDRARDHDVGLCLERRTPEHRNVCITNKLFLFLLAGIPIIATRTLGNREAAELCTGAVSLFEPGEFEELAGIMEKLVRDGRKRREAARAARNAAEQRCNWSHSRNAFLNAVRVSQTGRAAMRFQLPA